MITLSVSAVLSLAQGVDVRGIVSDSLTAQRIPFANVMLLNTSRGAATNNSGFYLIPRVPPGEYEIVASVIGYRRKVQRLIVRPGQPVDLNFQLASAPVENEEVLVTAARRREVTEINTSVHLLEQKDLKLAPVIAQEDVFQSLKMLPGIVSTSDVSSKFYVRGGAGDQNLVLIDGMKIYNPFHAMGIFSVFDPDIVQNVEMYTGAFPAGYGGRLSSVVNISSRDGRSDRLSAKAGLDFLSTKVHLEGPAIRGTTFMVNARKSEFSETFKHIVNQDVPVDFYDVFAKMNMQLPGGSKADFSLLTTSDKLPFAQNSSGGLAQEPDYFWRTTAFSCSFSDLIADRVFIQTFAYYSSYRANRGTSLNSTLTPSSTSVREAGLRAQATYYTDAQDLFFFGFDFGFPSIEYRPIDIPGQLSNSYHDFVDASTWVRYQAKFERWLVDLGLHADIGSIVVGEQGIEGLQPRLNVSYDFLGNWKLKASVGTFSQRSITVNNEDDVMPIFDAWIKVPGNIPPEKAVHFVTGVDGNLDAKTSISLQTYYKYYSSLVVYNRDKIDASDPDYIQGTGKSYGAEVLLRSRISLVDLYASYSLSWTTVNNSGLVYYPRYDRRHQLNLLASIQPFAHCEVTARWEYGSGFPYSATVGYFDRLMLGNPFHDPIELETGQPYTAIGGKNAMRLPQYHRLDLSATYRITIFGIKGSVGGQIINVYDNINIFYFNRKTGEHTEMLRFFPSATLSLEF
jgi:hypothetical protein